MSFTNVKGKMGNMRKEADWVVYPQSNPGSRTVTIQCDKRIAKVDLTTGKAILSSGKGGHQGFIMLDPLMGATLVECSPEILEQLRAIESKKQLPEGPQTVMG
jgi:hypothetical protein